MVINLYSCTENRWKHTIDLGKSNAVGDPFNGPVVSAIQHFQELCVIPTMDFVPEALGREFSDGNVHSSDFLVQYAQLELPSGTVHRNYDQNPRLMTVASYRVEHDQLHDHIEHNSNLYSPDVSYKYSKLYYHVGLKQIFKSRKGLKGIQLVQHAIQKPAKLDVTQVGVENKTQTT